MTNVLHATSALTAAILQMVACTSRTRLSQPHILMNGDCIHERAGGEIRQWCEEPCGYGEQCSRVEEARCRTLPTAGRGRHGTQVEEARPSCRTLPTRTGPFMMKLKRFGHVIGGGGGGAGGALGEADRTSTSFLSACPPRRTSAPALLDQPSRVHSKTNRGVISDLSGSLPSGAVTTRSRAPSSSVRSTTPRQVGARTAQASSPCAHQPPHTAGRTRTQRASTHARDCSRAPP